MMQPQYKKQIDEWIDSHADEMVKDLSTLMRIPSVRGQAQDGMPYGPEPARALEAMKDLMDTYGLHTRNYENHCVTGDLDPGKEKTLDILAHLDVVPVSDTWTKTQPFEPYVEGDRIYGRGSCDDKGPAIAALYAMRAVRETGIELKHSVRLICGSDEECGSGDLAYYYGIEKEAKYTFTPDVTGWYTFRIYTRDSNNTYADSRDLLLLVNPPVKNTSTVDSTKVHIEDALKINCSAEDGIGNYQYAVYVKKDGESSYKNVSDYSSDSVISIKFEETGKRVFYISAFSFNYSWCHK